MRKKFVPFATLAAAALIFVGCGRFFNPYDPIDPGKGGGGGKGGHGGGNGGGGRDTLVVDTLYVDPGDTVWVDPGDTLKHGYRH